MINSYISEYFPKYHAWYLRLSQREQRVVLIGTVAVGLFLIYAIWSGILNYLTGMRAQVNAQQKTLLWLQQADQQLSQLQGRQQARATVDSPVALLSILQNKLNKAGLGAALIQMKQTSNDAVSLQFQKVDFDRLMRFLAELTKTHAVNVNQLSATTENAPGIVNVEVIVKI